MTLSSNPARFAWTALAFVTIAAACLTATLTACVPPPTPLTPCNDDTSCPRTSRCVQGSCVYASLPASPSRDAGAPSRDEGVVDAGPAEDAGATDPIVDAGPEERCGNGALDPGEACDDGNRVDDGNGCDATCQRNAACGNGVLEALFEVCDPGQEACCNATCTGPRGEGARCREPAGACDLVERCDGRSFECPIDRLEEPGAVCRPGNGVCDPVEICDGTSPFCPDDAVAPSGEPCGSQTANACTGRDTCDGEGRCDANHAPTGAPCEACDDPLGCQCVAGSCDDASVALSIVALGTLSSDEPYPATTGTHTHSGPSGEVEVGTWETTEECRGIVEFDPGALSRVSAAQLTFEVAALSGFDEQTGPGAFEIVVEAYLGDGTRTDSDYQIAADPVGVFLTQGLTVGEVFLYDVTALVNDALSENPDALGLRLRAVTDPGPNTAVRFGSFELLVLP